MVTSCGAYIQPLDLQCLFVNVFSGTPVIFGVIALIITVILAARFRMPSVLAGSAIVVFAMIFQQYIGGLYYIIVLISAIVISIIIANLIKR